MKALIFNNKVVDVQTTEFDVHSSMSWVDCDNTVEIGFNYDGTNFTSNQLTAEQIETAQAKKAQRDADALAGNNKLLGLGLTQAEVTAMTGYKPPVSE